MSARTARIDSWPSYRPGIRAEVDRTEGVNYWDEPDGDDRFLRLTAACVPRELDYRGLFQALGNEDMGLQPALAGRVFLVNETNPVVFHMYDDRGADVYARDADRLAAVTGSPSPLR
jgi:hypothetical protein